MPFPCTCCAKNLLSCVVDESYMEYLDAIAKRFSAEADSADAEADKLLAELTAIRARARCLCKQVAQATSNANKIMRNEIEYLDVKDPSVDNAGCGATSVDQAVAASPVMSSLALCHYYGELGGSRVTKALVRGAVRLKKILWLELANACIKFLRIQFVLRAFTNDLI
ncbi:hypothetical protein GP486_007940 [Trichoglossum hirsutum]|uniref:Uncharacterized protein n=1 Tax=Trichoglossum hirsutum TaxID=265104 RepID=A0A9P8IAT3_9PEZI|nr:hypothetical protein GP486_007940 [Trichoglossum hirsutum]